MTDQPAVGPNTIGPERVYQTYRILLAVSLASVFYITWPKPLMGDHMPKLFAITIMAYGFITLATSIFSDFLRAKFPSWNDLVNIFIDVIAITLMIHASGGINSNLSVLLIISVAAASIIAPRVGGLFTAAVCTFAVMFEQFWFALSTIASNPFQLTESGLLGISFFFTAFIIQTIARRLTQAEALGLKQQAEIQRLAALNKQVVQRMRTGILVFDSERRILMTNASTQEYLAHENIRLGDPVPTILLDQYLEKNKVASPNRSPIKLGDHGQHFLIRFAHLEDNPGTPVLCFIEDQRLIAKEAQQLKLASLGRLTATIAHEIRNPLSAINHAADLLADSPKDKGDKRLLDIINHHVGRVNLIISDILSLSRRQSSAAERIILLPVVEKAANKWQQQGVIIDIKCSFSELEIRFDKSQLEQVLDNLIRNAATHGGDNANITLTLDRDPNRDLPRLLVQDDGPGVDTSIQTNLFEPFFTTSNEGTGLGLFLCRELCESNQAWLDYIPQQKGACFVITFAHPDRVFE